MCSKGRLQQSTLQHLNPQWVIQRGRGRGVILRTERTRKCENKGTEEEDEVEEEEEKGHGMKED